LRHSGANTRRILIALVQEVSLLYDVGYLTPKAVAAPRVKADKSIYALIELFSLWSSFDRHMSGARKIDQNKEQKQ
jgi:hypothetical protein